MLQSDSQVIPALKGDDQFLGNVGERVVGNVQTHEAIQIVHQRVRESHFAAFVVVIQFIAGERESLELLHLVEGVRDTRQLIVVQIQLEKRRGEILQLSLRDGSEPISGQIQNVEAFDSAEEFADGFQIDVGEKQLSNFPPDVWV